MCARGRDPGGQPSFLSGGLGPAATLSESGSGSEALKTWMSTLEATV